MQRRDAKPRSDLIVCPRCDAAFSLKDRLPGMRFDCARCGKVLIRPRRVAALHIIGLSFAIFLLLMAAVLLPFLSISVAGVRNSASILDVVFTFSTGPMVFLTLATVSLVLLIPLLRVFLSIYVLLPLVRHRPPARYAASAFRLADALRPWSMAEVFIIGCAIAMVKVGNMADLSIGPAFWAFCILVVLVIVQDTITCRWSVWNALSRPT